MTVHGDITIKNWSKLPKSEKIELTRNDADGALKLLYKSAGIERSCGGWVKTIQKWGVYYKGIELWSKTPPAAIARYKRYGGNTEDLDLFKIYDGIPLK